MNAKRYFQIRQLFDAVLERPQSEQEPFLRASANGDRELREEVLRLLRASDRGVDLFANAPSVDLSKPERVMAKAEGRRLGPYELVREIGEGGMGVVYLARRADGVFEKDVAIKIVRRELATPQFLTRFQRERQILAKLEHPHIARLLDGGFAPEPYFVMEYVDGETILKYADSQRLSYDDRLGLLRQVAEAVDYAHQQGVVHRDLKPSNIFVDGGGQVKLLDFGIAAWQQDDAKESEIAPTVALSPAYASPEQARGEKTTRASDIYSLAMVAHELLAGVLPFDLQNANLQTVLEIISQREPKPASQLVRESTHPGPAALGRLRRMAPIALVERLANGGDAAFQKALAKRREERPASAVELVNSLSIDRSHSTKESLAQRFAKNRTELYFLGAIVAIGLLAAGRDLSLSHFGWGLVAAIFAFAVLIRYRIASRLMNLPAVLLVVAILLPVSWINSHPAYVPEGVVKHLGIASLVLYTAIFLWLRLLQPSRLGNLLIRSGDRKMEMFLCGMVLLRTVMAFQRNTQLLDSVMLLSFAVRVHGLEIREQGIAVGIQIIQWRDILNYRWVEANELEFTLIGSLWTAAASEITVRVKAEDAERIKHILSDILIEKEIAAQPLIFGGIA